MSCSLDMFPFLNNLVHCESWGAILCLKNLILLSLEIHCEFLWGANLNLGSLPLRPRTTCYVDKPYCTAKTSFFQYSARKIRKHFCGYIVSDASSVPVKRLVVILTSSKNASACLGTSKGGSGEEWIIKSTQHTHRADPCVFVQDFYLSQQCNGLYRYKPHPRGVILN